MKLMVKLVLLEMLDVAEWKLIAKFDEKRHVSYTMSSDQHEKILSLSQSLGQRNSVILLNNRFVVPEV